MFSEEGKVHERFALPSSRLSLRRMPLARRSGRATAVLIGNSDETYERGVPFCEPLAE
jgi:hypothetical protein